MPNFTHAWDAVENLLHFVQRNLLYYGAIPINGGTENSI